MEALPIGRRNVQKTAFAVKHSLPCWFSSGEISPPHWVVWA